MTVSQIIWMLMSLALAFTIGCGSSTAPFELSGKKGANVQKAEPGSVESVFEGLPSELATNLRADDAQRVKANAWLVANVNGKSKPVRLTVAAASMQPPEAQNAQFVAKLELFGTRDSLLGDSWVIFVHDGRFQKREGGFATESFEFVGLSEIDAKWLSDLTLVTVEGQVDEAAIIPDDQDGAIISLKLKGTKVNGKSFRAGVPKK